MDGLGVRTAEASPRTLGDITTVDRLEEITQQLPRQSPVPLVENRPRDTPQQSSAKDVPARRQPRMRIPQAWALTLPVDLLALAAPVLWVDGY